jgi:hypothetical protein
VLCLFDKHANDNVGINFCHCFDCRYSLNLLLQVGHSAAIFANSLMSSISDSILFVILSILASSVIIIVGLKLDIRGLTNLPDQYRSGIKMYLEIYSGRGNLNDSRRCHKTNSGRRIGYTGIRAAIY